MGKGKKREEEAEAEEEEAQDEGEEEAGEEEGNEEEAEEGDEEDEYDVCGEEDANSSDEFEPVKSEYENKEQTGRKAKSGFIQSDQNEQLLRLEQILPPHLIHKKADQLRAQTGKSKFQDADFNQKTNKSKHRF